MSNEITLLPKGKNMCPQCGVNTKGIKAKTCRPCAKLNLAQLQKIKSEETKAKKLTNKAAEIYIDQQDKAVEERNASLGDAVKLKLAELQKEEDALAEAQAKAQEEVNEIAEHEEFEEQEKPKIGATTPDGKYYL